jgi:hypothetical protein
MVSVREGCVVYNGQYVFIVVNEGLKGIVQQ